MTYEQACRIMGLTHDCGKKELKKIYHKLMHEVHPDANPEQKSSYPYTAQELNEAYSVLLTEMQNHKTYGSTENDIQYEGDASKNRTHAGKTAKSQSKTKKTGWNAPVNPNAYTSREILQNVEDYDGTVMGSFVIAEGKYYWTPEEEFSLFLQSTFACGKRLLAQVDERLGRDSQISRHMQLQAKLTYLLTQQFIDMDATLARLAKEEEKEEENMSDAACHTFYLAAMLELDAGAPVPASGQILYPCAMKERKLYLSDTKGRKLGYLSFLDDRMYYVVIPLFEQRRAQVKIQTAKPRTASQKRRRTAASYTDIDLWIRIPRVTDTSLPENLNQQIEAVLRKYETVN